MASAQYIVVLAGWLGCKAQSLQRYEKMYHRLLTGGVTFIPVIAPPLWIVQACMNHPKNMDAMAQQLIRDIIATQMERSETKADATTATAAMHIYFHAFSNAGCILWDRFRQELLNESRVVMVASNNRRVLNGINGVIFDSCPIVELSRIQDALKHCTWRERAQVVRNCGGLDYTKAVHLSSFSDRFQTSLRTDPLPIPQLYLFSRNDRLTPHEFIRNLVQYRQQQQCLTRIIHAHCWDDSAHCAHLLQHPESYENVVDEFLVMTRTIINPTRSKL